MDPLLACSCIDTHSNNWLRISARGLRILLRHLCKLPFRSSSVALSPSPPRALPEVTGSGFLLLRNTVGDSECDGCMSGDRRPAILNYVQPNQPSATTDIPVHKVFVKGKEAKSSTISVFMVSAFSMDTLLS